jgi:hypothetical protein
MRPDAFGEFRRKSEALWRLIHSQRETISFEDMYEDGLDATCLPNYLGN